MVPATKKAKLVTPIDNLSDPLIARIFRCLDIRQRFKVAEVCQRWLAVSKIPWSDIKRLTFSQISSPKINVVLRRCPKIGEASLRRLTVILTDDSDLPQTCESLHSLNFANVDFMRNSLELTYQSSYVEQQLLADYFGKFPNLKSLVWYNLPHEIVAGEESTAAVRNSLLPEQMPQHLKRLFVINSYRMCNPWCQTLAAIPTLQQLQQLECLVIAGPSLQPARESDVPSLMSAWWQGLSGMQFLRELCIVPVSVFAGAVISLKSLAAVACDNLTSLQVLIYASSSEVSHEGLSQLITSHRTLQILIVSGSDSEVTAASISTRKLRNSEGRKLPLLSVFIGGKICRMFRFAQPQSGAANFYKMDCPLPQFLAKPEFAHIFEGVWMVGIIRRDGVDPIASVNADEGFFNSKSKLKFYDPSSNPNDADFDPGVSDSEPEPDTASSDTDSDGSIEY